MVLDTIYITRHGARANWSQGPPKLHSSGRLPPDTPLSEAGEVQAEELAVHAMKLDLPVGLIYSSPFYRCVQTIAPLISLASKERLQQPLQKIRGEPGLGEWYGRFRTEDPRPASPQVLQSFFPEYDLQYEIVWTPEPTGESIEELHRRAAYTMAGIIQKLANDPVAPRSIMICTHAATFMALARVLTGHFPEDITAQDFEPWTASLSTFTRRKVEKITATLDSRPGDTLPELSWTGGVGIGGGWDCVVSGDCSFLSAGKDRGWRFSGKESFSHALTAHGVDAGTGLGIISDIFTEVLAVSKERYGTDHRECARVAVSLSEVNEIMGLGTGYDSGIELEEG